MLLLCSFVLWCIELANHTTVTHSYFLHIQSLLSPGMVHQGWRSVAERGHVDSCGWGMEEFLVYMTQYGGRSACRPMVTVSFCCSGMSSQAATTLFAATSARSLPLIFVCPLILCRDVGSPSLALYKRMSTMAVMSGL